MIMRPSFPVYPDKQKFSVSVDMSQRGQSRFAPMACRLMIPYVRKCLKALERRC